MDESPARKAELKQKADSFENLLRVETNISFMDKVRNIKTNVLGNISYLIPFGITAGIAGLATWAGFEAYDISSRAEFYDQAHSWVSNLSKVLTTSTENNIPFEFSSEMIDMPVKLVEQGAKEIYPEEAKEVLKYVSDNRALFSGEACGEGEIKKRLEFLDEFEDKIFSLRGQGTQLLLGVGTFIGGVIGSIGSLFAGAYALDEFDFTSNLEDKRSLKLRLDREWPGIRDDLAATPHAFMAYEFLEKIKESGTPSRDIFPIAGRLGQISDPRHGPVLELLLNNPMRYADSNCIANVIREFDNELTREEREAGEISGRLRTAGSRLHKPAKYSEIYLSLVGRGWQIGDISRIISGIEILDEDKSYFLDRLKEDKTSQGLFSNIRSFHQQSVQLPSDKRLALVKYMFQKENRQLASQLSFSNISDGGLMDYIARVDEIPGVGVKGQVRTIVKLNNALKQLGMLRKSTNLDALSEIVSYQRPKFDEGAIEVTDFLSRHPNISSENAMGALFEYYFLTGGDQFNSNWIKKEQNMMEKRENSAPVEVDGLLDGRCERKFSEELERKVRIAKFEAFNREIDDLYYAPLDEVLGERIERTEITLDSDLINVVAGYHSIDFGSEFRPKLRDLLKVRLTTPDLVQGHLDGLPGNMSLEKKVNWKVLTSWKQGYDQLYDVNMGSDAKRALRERANHEYGELTRCLSELGHEFTPEKNLDKKKDRVKNAEVAFKKVSKADIPDEKMYLLIEAKGHLKNFKQQAGIIRSGSRSVRFYDSKDPIESMQMGVVTNSCTNITHGVNSYTSVACALDNNKKVIYMTDECGKKIARTLAVLTDQGIVTFHKYDNNNLNTNGVWTDYFQEYSQRIGLPLMVPATYVDGGLKKVLKNRRAKKTIVRPKMQKAVSTSWYGDCLGGRLKIGENGHTFNFEAYVLKPS
jgi:hypothetical protein